MKVSFLGQGFESISENSVGNLLLKFLSETKFHSFTGISAFASEAGIIGLAENITSAKKRFRNLNLIVGIDQSGTSKEALFEINNLKINSFIFYQIESPIFHPKIYLFEGNKDVKLILGSSNLTARGLFGNIESSLLIEFPVNDKDGKKLLTELKHYYKTLFNFTDPNLFKITSKTIKSFIELGIVPKETVRLRKHGKQLSDKKKAGKLILGIPKRKTVKIPNTFRGKPKEKKIISKIAKELQISKVIKIDANTLVWQKKNLPRSDAQQVTGNTAITGVLRLGDANFKFNDNRIDRNIYFRNDIFGHLNWSLEHRKNNNPLQVAHGNFIIYIDGKRIGKYTLKISHDPERISGQHNVSSTIHWGPRLNNYLKNNNITGKTLNLYSSLENSDAFRIDIK